MEINQPRFLSRARLDIDNFHDVLFNAALLESLLGRVVPLLHSAPLVCVYLINRHRRNTSREHFSTMCSAFNHINDILLVEEFYFRAVHARSR